MKHTGQIQQPDSAGRPADLLAAGRLPYEWQNRWEDHIENEQTALFRVVLDLEADEAVGPSARPAVEPSVGSSAGLPVDTPASAPASQPAEPPAAAPSAEDDLLVIPLRPAERRAGDFLPGWVRRFSRA